MDYYQPAMTNINHKAYAMNVFTPMAPWKTPILRLIFFLFGAFSSKKELKQLSFIHFARWVIVKRGRFPFLGGGQPPEELHYDYLLFCSNFNGTWNQYIDAFSSGIPAGLNALWLWSVKYPGAVPITPFKEYIARNQFDTDYYYSAYPGAATNDVKAALRVEAQLEAFGKESQDLPPAEFAKAYLRFLTRVQGDLGSTGAAPQGT